MKVHVIYDDGSRELVEGETWVEVVGKVACHAISLTVVEDNPEPGPGHCICTEECDCQDYEGGFVSQECPVHNDRPSPHPDCKAERHWWEGS